MRSGTTTRHLLHHVGDFISPQQLPAHIMAGISRASSPQEVQNAVSNEDETQQRPSPADNATDSLNPVDLNSDPASSNPDNELLKETKLLRDTLDLLWNQTLEQRNICQDLERENEYLQEYIGNLMTSSNVLEK